MSWGKLATHYSVDEITGELQDGFSQYWHIGVTFGAVAVMGGATAMYMRFNSKSPHGPARLGVFVGVDLGSPSALQPDGCAPSRTILGLPTPGRPTGFWRLLRAHQGIAADSPG